MEEAKISISINEGKFEISGSENFVNKQIENFKSIIEKSLENPTIQNPTDTIKHVEIVSQSPISTNSTSNKLDDKYSDIFVIDGEDVKIICDIPGNNSAEKTLNAALIYALAKKESGTEEVNVGEIKHICQNHGFLDKKNFSTHIKKGDPKLYLDKGNGNSRVIKLVRPGEKKAQELIELILAE